MTFTDAGPSPAWLGAAAIISFGGLVVTAFASGYHLATDLPPAPIAAPVKAAPSAAAANAAAFAPVPGRVAEPLVDRAKAVLRAEPEGGEVIDELPSGRSVTISRESGDWLFVRYERDGQEREGWAHRINIERQEP